MTANILDSPSWMAYAITLPLLGAIIGFVLPRYAATVGIFVSFAINACVVITALQIIEWGPIRYAVGGWGAPLGIDLYADGLAAIMLLVTAVVGLLVGWYALDYFHDGQRFEARRAAPPAQTQRYFWPLWMLDWAALNALFLAADAFNIYVGLELMGVSAVALIALGADSEALTGAMRYLLVSLLGSLCYLLATGLLYAQYATLDLSALGEAVSPLPVTWTAFALMATALALKTALFPMHFWLPPAHANAPTPVSAVLSALVVKASFYLLLRYWFQVFPSLITTTAANLLGLLGAAAIVWGSIQALLAQRLKLLVAYSTVAQVGYLFLVFPLAQSPMVAFTAWSAVTYYAVSHALAKAAMFLTAGTILHSAGHDRISIIRGVTQLPVSMFAFGLAGMSLLGLPPSGGFIAKWMLLEAAFIGGQWWWAVIIILGSLLAAGYVFRVLGHAVQPPPIAIPPRRVPWGMEWSALALALAALFMGIFAPQPLALIQQGAPVANHSSAGIAP